MTFYTNITTVFELVHSTDLCLSYLNKILKSFDNGLLTGMILIDLQKTFNTIDHNILLEKLKAIGFSEGTVNWFHSYFTDRAFIASIENKYSSITKISCGVPQRSILGLFLHLENFMLCLKGQFLALFYASRKFYMVRVKGQFLALFFSFFFFFFDTHQ